MTIAICALLEDEALIAADGKVIDIESMTVVRDNDQKVEVLSKNLAAVGLGAELGIKIALSEIRQKLPTCKSLNEIEQLFKNSVDNSWIRFMNHYGHGKNHNNPFFKVGCLFAGTIDGSNFIGGVIKSLNSVCSLIETEPGRWIVKGGEECNSREDFNVRQKSTPFGLWDYAGVMKCCEATIRHAEKCYNLYGGRITYSIIRAGQPVDVKDL
ncbi:MAG: hypothetical protein V1715_13310 [bacterium]